MVLNVVSDYLTHLFSTDGFPPRWWCGHWTAFHGWLYILSDLSIWAAYFTIPVILVYFVRRRKDLPFPRIFFLFAAFIFACGTTHLLDAVMFWWPAYRLSGLVYMATAIISWATIMALIPIMPIAISLRSPKELEREVTERKRLEAALQAQNEALESLVQARTTELTQLKNELEERVHARTVELQNNTSLLNSIIDNVPGMIFLKDAEHLRFKLFNKAAEQIVGYSFEELADKNDYDMFPEEQAAFFTQKDRETLLGNNLLDIQEELIETRTGETRILHTKKVPIMDENGRPHYLLGISEDITEIKRTHEQVARLNQELEKQVQSLYAVNKELEAFSYSVSHDLRAPLRAIDGFSQAVFDSCEHKLNDKERDYLQRVRTGSQQMAQLIDDMLNLSRITRGDLNIKPELNLTDIANEIIAELRRQDPERQVEWVAAADVTVSGDRHLLQSVLQNLLGNAWKFTAQHTKARIEWGIRWDIMPNGPKTNNIDSQPVYFVKDDGAGFNMAYVDKLFGAFQRLHGVHEFPGTGIGLASVQRIIHRHGGKIWTEAEVEKGATFYFTLDPSPIYPSEEANP